MSPCPCVGLPPAPPAGWPLGVAVHLLVSVRAFGGKWAASSRQHGANAPCLWTWHGNGRNGRNGRLSILTLGTFNYSPTNTSKLVSELNEQMPFLDYGKNLVTKNNDNN
eukprot:3252712-Amphidinium_carterae.1